MARVLTTRTKRVPMIKHYLYLAFRNFVRFKGTFAINVVGLSAGLTAALLIFLWIRDEQQMDKYNAHDERLYQVLLRTEEGGEINVGTELPPTLAEALLQEQPDVELAVTEGILPMKSLLAKGDLSIKTTGAYVEPGYFKIFSLGVEESQSQALLDHENSIVISSSIATALLGSSEGAVGKTITFDGKEELMVAGVFDFPQNSSRRFDFAIPFKRMFVHQSNFKNNWNNTWPSVYVRLKDGVDPGTFNEKIASFYSRHSGQQHKQVFLDRFSDRYLRGHFENGVKSGGRVQYVKLFAIIALAIVLIACMNFANLATARATERMKEVGVKKTFGVTRRSLTAQYLMESFVITGLAMVFAIALVASLLPSFNLITGKELQLGFHSDLVYVCIGITISTALLAGVYPAFYLSAFSPAVVLRQKFRTSGGALWVRKGLVVIQFSLSIAFIIGVMVVYRQLQLIQHENLGYDRRGVLYFEMEPVVKAHQAAFLDGLRNVDGVQNASAIWWGFLGQRNGTSDLAWPGKDPNLEIGMQYRRVDDGLLEVLGIKLAGGTSFSSKIPSSHDGIIVNQTAVRAMGLNDPVGKTIKLWGADREIIGVAEDFHFETLYENVQPLFFLYNPERTNTVMLKVDPTRAEMTIQNVTDYYRRMVSNAPLDLRFLDDDFQAQYVSEKRVEALSKYFTLIAVVLSCLGVLGLAAYATERRTREIGIRKTLGSSEWAIVYLLTRDFTKPVLVAIVVSLPTIYLLASQWLNAFKVRIDLSWVYFVAGAFLALALCWITVGVHAIRAARLNPARGLRAE